MTLVAALILGLVQQDPDRIQDLIRKLGSDDFATREQATEDLKKTGASAREALQKAADHSDDPEVRQRARALLEELARAEHAPPRRGDSAPAPGRPRPGVPGFAGSSVTVRSVNGDSTYVIRPGDGSPVLTFFKAASGQVKLDFVDDKGETKSVESASLAAFLKEHAELAEKFGVSEDGISYAGGRVSFKGSTLPDFRFPRLTVPGRPNRLPPPPSEEEEGTTVAGAKLVGVDDSLRAQLDIPDGQGVVVSRVTPGSPAESLGLRKNDILLELDGKKIAAPEAASDLIRPDGTAVVIRKGQRTSLGRKKDF